MEKLLIAYHSKTGSTKEVSEKIALALTESNFNVVVLPMTEVGSLEGYDAVIIGAPINGFRWVPEADQFIGRFKEELMKKPVFTFCLSYLSHYPRPFFRNMIRNNYEKSNAGLSPKKTAVFGGISMNGAGFPTLVRWVFGVPSTIPADTREWPQIVKWANDLGTELKDGF